MGLVVPVTFPPKKDPVLIVKEAGWAPGMFRAGVENLFLPTGIRSPDRPAHDESQHQLRYLGPHYYSIHYNCNYNYYYCCFVCYLQHKFSLAPLCLYSPDDRGTTLCCLGTEELHCTHCHCSMWQEQIKTINNLFIIKVQVLITKRTFFVPDESFLQHSGTSFFSGDCGFTLSVSFHQCSVITFIYLPSKLCDLTTDSVGKINF